MSSQQTFPKGFMTYAADSSLDFASIARELGVSQSKQGASPIGMVRELVPAEAQSRMQREGRNFLRRPAQNGATVDQEGLLNNYAVEPDLYYASFPSPEQARQYAFQGAAAALLVLGLIMTTAAIS